MVATRRGRPTRAQTATLDLAIRKAAVATFLEFGYPGATVDAIARAAGTTKRSVYARYADKRAIFIDVIPWALSRYADSDRDEMPGDDEDEDLETALLRIGRVALARAVDPEHVGLMRIAMNEAARFSEFDVAMHSMMWSGRQRAVVRLLRRHQERGHVRVDDIQIAAEHFLAMVELVPGRLADFGFFRTEKDSERHLRQAVSLFMRGAVPQRTGRR